jgi:hypothetical protein
MCRSSIAIRKTYQEWEPHSIATRRVSEGALKHGEIRVHWTGALYIAPAQNSLCGFVSRRRRAKANVQTDNDGESGIDKSHEERLSHRVAHTPTYE